MPEQGLLLSDAMMVDLAMQYLDKQELSKLFERTTTKLSGAFNLYKMPEVWVTAPATVDPIRGENPPCGQGNADIAMESKVAAAGIQLVGVAADALGGGGYCSVIAGVINTFVLQNKYRTDCVCRDLILLLPGKLDAKWVMDHTHISYTLRDWEGQRAVSPGQLAWGYIEAMMLPDDPYVNIKTKDDHVCEMTMLYGRLKNWSHNNDRSVLVTALMDDLPLGSSSCLDFSIVNRALYDHDIVLSMDEELRKKIINIYIQELSQAK